MENNPIIILTSVSSHQEGEKLASGLVENELAACVNILPKMTSVYRWKKIVNVESEYELLIKTTQHLENQVYVFIQDTHSYEVPEIITLNIKNIDKKYYEWLNSNIQLKTNGKY